MTRTSFEICIICFILIFLVSSANLYGAEYRGYIYMDDYYSNDSSSAYDFNILTTRMRMDVNKLKEIEGLSFHFDGREKNNFTSQDYSSRTKNTRIDTMNIEYSEKGRFNLSAGRLWPKELPTERVDGINILLNQNNSGVGIFGGAKPDPYTEEFNSNFTSMGGYIYYHKVNLSANLAITQNEYKGDTDRQYMYTQLTYSPSEKINIYGSITADINQSTDNLDLTNLMIDLSYRPDNRKGLSFGYTQFRSFQLYSSMDFEIEKSQQQQYYVRGDYQFLDRYSIYGRYELQTLYYKLIEEELRDSDTYQIGIRDNNLLNQKIGLDINTTFVDSYSSNYITYNLQMSRIFNEVFQLNVNGSYMENSYELTGYTDKITGYDISGYYTMNRWWNFSLSIEGRHAEEYDTSSIFTRISYRF
ncbi:MAG TPA: hypothetical protein DDX84_12665 [Nitrospiraceae bacterium]|nr:hypothetical protein [Nitrospiraceae bacterium]